MKHIGPIQSSQHMTSSTSSHRNNFLSSWYLIKIAHLVLNNNRSLSLSYIHTFTFLDTFFCATSTCSTFTSLW